MTKTPFNSLTITRADGSKQVIKPDLTYFEGDWGRLAEAIAGTDFNKKGVNWSVK